VGFNASHVSSESALLDGGQTKTGLNVGFVAGVQLTPYDAAVL